ncbi:MAG: hypothetical protein H0X17_16905 [Deltaproteobacteria bacterium]|nr:hypothetical protein [Deltaproteobacteria bacterium]
MRRVIFTCCFVVGASVAIGACGGEESGDEEAAVVIEPAKDAITKTVETGPVKATVKVWPPQPTLGDTIYVRLEVEAPAGISIDAPFQEAGDQRLGRFKVLGFVRDTARQPDGGQLHEQTYTLEAQTSGRHRVPPLRLEMLDGRSGAGSGEQAKPQEILTDEIPLEIAPVKTEAVDAALRPARGALDPDVGGTSWMLVLGLVSFGLVAISGGVLLVRGMRARRGLEQQRSAYDDAVAQLRALEDRGAPDAAAADSWFVALSAIVRTYLEKRYGIRAPELTTEEFLQHVADHRTDGSARLSAEHRALLVQFLERCDRVKFAGYRPDAEESLATLAAARGFIEDTRLRADTLARAA